MSMPRCSQTRRDVFAHLKRILRIGRLRLRGNRFDPIGDTQGDAENDLLQREDEDEDAASLARRQTWAPDVLVWYCGETIAMELKSRCRRGAVGRGARASCGRALSGGNAARRTRHVGAEPSDVSFRTIPSDDGRIESWQQPDLAPWEVPRRDPAEPRPSTRERWQHSAGRRSSGGGCGRRLRGSAQRRPKRHKVSREYDVSRARKKPTAIPLYRPQVLNSGQNC